MSRGRWKREHELPSFPFHCYTNPDPDALQVASLEGIVIDTAALLW
jgi:hypothetical protein